MRLIFLFLSIIFSGPVLASEIPGSQYSVGAWIGGAYTSNTDGKFSGCIISAIYQSGDTLFLSINADTSISIGVSNSTFNLTPGVQIPASLHIDKYKPVLGTFVTSSKNLASVYVADYRSILPALQKGSRLSIKTNTGVLTYNLKDTFKALEQTKDCLARYYNFAAAVPTVPKNQDPTLKTPVASGNQDTVQTSKDAGTIDKAILYQLAAQMIAQTGVADFKFSSTKEATTLFGENAVAWSSAKTGLIGAVALYERAPDYELHIDDANDIATLSTGCAGKLASATQTISIDDKPAREIRVLCENDGIKTDTVVVKTKVENYILYSFLLYEDKGQKTVLDDIKSVQHEGVRRAAHLLQEDENE